jgi:MFS transporter, OFA family, oxalate/formate antiporter
MSGSDSDTRPENKPVKISRGWVALIVVGLYYATISGLMINCIGVLFAGILKDMGFETSELSAYHSIRFVVSALIVRRLCKIFDTCRKPNVFMASTGFITAASFALMPLYTKAWHWYISAVMLSTASAEMIYIVSVVVNNWFSKNQGTIVGFTLMSSGISAALFGPVCSSIITKYGWRAACLAIAGISVVTWILPCYFLFVRAPEDVGASPVGAEDVGTTREAAAADHHIVPSERLWPVLALGIALPSSISALNNQLPTFATNIGYDLSVGAVISSCSMVGNMLYKPLLGIVADKIGAINAGRLFYGITIAGFICILNAHSSVYLIYAGAILYGAIFACTVTAPSLVCREMYGDKLYKDRLSRTQPISTMLSAVTSFLYPKIYDVLGTWSPVFAVCACLCAVGIISLTVAQIHILRRRASET